MVFEDHGIVASRENAADCVTESSTAGEFVGGECGVPADVPSLVKNTRVRNLVGHAEGNQGNRMGMHDAPYVRAAVVDLQMKRELGRGSTNPIHGAIGMDADNILAPQRALVDASWGNPDVAIIFAHGKIPTGGGGHPVAIDPLHEREQLISRMQIRRRRRH
jgi:hypothetical protein